jgi:hypothetical protein
MIDTGVAQRLLVLVLLCLAASPLCLILYSVMAFKTYPSTTEGLPISGFRAGHGRYQLTAFTGALVEASRSTTKAVYTEYNSHGVALSSHHVITVYDNLVLRDYWGNTQAFLVADFHVATAFGHWLTVVSAARPRGGPSHYVAVLDRTSGSSFFRSQSWGLFLGPLRMSAALVMAIILGFALSFVIGTGTVTLPLFVMFVLYAGTKQSVATFRQRVTART